VDLDALDLVELGVGQPRVFPYRLVAIVCLLSGRVGGVVRPAAPWEHDAQQKRKLQDLHHLSQAQK
jgi:hypothetical protein